MSPIPPIEQFVQKNIDPIMRENKFKKKGLVWNRTEGIVTHVVELQTSQWNDAESHSFTINYGVWAKQLWRLLWDNKIPNVIGEDECFPRFRIGELTEHSTVDLWWALESVSNEKLSNEVQGLIKNEILYHLNGCNAINKMLPLAEKAGGWQHPADRLSYAILCHLNGRYEIAEKILSEMKEDDKLTAWKQRIEKVRTRLD